MGVVLLSLVLTMMLVLIGKDVLCGAPKILLIDGDEHQLPSSMLNAAHHTAPGGGSHDHSGTTAMASVAVVPLLAQTPRQPLAQSSDPSQNRNAMPALGDASGTVIIMFDNRPPVDRGAPYEYWVHSAKLNSLYACAHGYDFIYLLDNATFDPSFTRLTPGANMKSKIVAASFLNKTVPRSAPWGKLSAVAHTLALGYDTVVFVDSDAFLKVGDRGLSIEALEKYYRGNYKYKTPHPPEYDPVESERTKGRGMYVAGDYAGRANNEPNTGLHIWHNSPAAWEVLRAWWRTDVFAMEHPYEQNALWSKLFKSKGLHEKWAVLGRLAWQNRDGWPRHPATHMNSFVHKNWRRDFYNEAFNWSEPIKQFLGNACPALQTQVRSVDSSVAIERYLDD